MSENVYKFGRKAASHVVSSILVGNEWLVYVVEVFDDDVKSMGTVHFTQPHGIVLQTRLDDGNLCIDTTEMSYPGQ